MKSAIFFPASIIQLIVGLSAVAAFLLLFANGEAVGKWIPALAVAVGLIVSAVLGILNRTKHRNIEDS